MKFILSLLASFLFTASFSQAIKYNNFNYLYNSRSDIIINIRPIILEDDISVFYVAKTGKADPTTYIFNWEKRKSYSQNTGVPIKSDTVTMTNKEAWIGEMKFPKPDSAWILVVEAKIINRTKSVLFIKQIEPNYPINGYLVKGDEVQFSQYIDSKNQYVVHGSTMEKPIFFFYYKEPFLQPSPPFTEKEVEKSKFIFPDSTFSIMSGDTIGPFKGEGLYLAQEDTLSSMGFSFLVKNLPFPKYNKLDQLKYPLLYVTTHKEFEQIEESGENKAKFDKVILEITNGKDLAKKFMRNYFRRVVNANSVFSTYKEGWKSDKGMIMIIYGPPYKVTLDNGIEKWKYFGSINQEFSFVKAGSIYYPENYVLIRNKKYSKKWYTMIDLWRKGRF